MKAFFLAGGMGTRLQPLTDHIPKPMVPILGKPLLERNMKRLQGFDISDIVLSVCYLPECIENHFGNGNTFGMEIAYTYEDTPLGTGGAIKYAAPQLGERFFVFNADILCDIDYGHMLRFHKAMHADITIAVTKVEDPTAYGVIETDALGYATAFTEKPKPGEVRSNLINAGIYIMERHVLEDVPAGQKISAEREIFPRILEEGGKIAAYDNCRYWLDIGTKEKYMQAQRDAFQGKYHIEEASFAENTIYSEVGARLYGPVVIKGPVYIGKHVHIGKGAVIGPNVVVGDNSIIGQNAHLENAVLWNDVVVRSDAHVRDTVLTTGESTTGTAYQPSIQAEYMV